MQSTERSARTRLLISAAAAALVAGVASTAQAQSASPVTATQVAPPGQSTQVDEVVVTGSRINRTGFSAPTPTTVVGAEDLQRQAATNPADLLNTLPEVRATVSATVHTAGMDAGGNYVDLRGLGISRTLTLVNGERHVPTNITGQTDLNLIPAILIDRVEVVTGGASAAYGSDAVAGVVNLIFKRNFEGLQGNLQGSGSWHGDNDSVDAGLLYGTSFLEDKGHFMLAGQYDDNNGGGSFHSRDWGRTNYLLIPNPNYVAGNGQPSRLFVGDVRQSNTTTGGLINGPSALRGIQFAPDGTPVPFHYGSPVGSQNMVGGDGDLLAPYQLINPPLKRYSINGRVSYELTPDIEAGLEFSGAHAKVTSRGGTANDTALTIRSDNAYLPAAIRTLMAANNLSTITVGRQESDISLDPSNPWYMVTNQTTVYRGVASLKGKFDNGWSWDAYYEHGETKNDELLVGNRINANFTRAVDAVVNPATGAVVCRSTLSSDPAVRAAAAGCVPYNIFGYYVRSDDAARYVGGDSQTINNVNLKEDAVSVSAQGDFYHTWAGPISLAVGGEWHEDRAYSETDPISQANGFNNYNPKPIQGTYSVKEAFAETVVPLAKDLPFAESLEFNGGARIADYNRAGSVTSWKAGLNYNPIHDLRLRATRSRDVRAPNINELYSTTTSAIQTLIDPLNNAGTTLAVISGGNINLKPEKADTTTIGLVYEPGWFSGLQVSVDAYDINIKDVISTLNPQDAINRCYAGETNLCSTVIRDASGRLVTVSQQFQNFASLHTQGADFELTYRTPLDRFSDNLPGSVTAHLLTTYVKHLKTSDGVTTIDVAGETSGLRVGDVPHWSGSLVLGYDNGPLMVSTQIRYVGSGKQDAIGTPLTINDNSVPSRTYVQLSTSYDLVRHDDGRSLQLFAVVNNLFDTDPPPTAGSTWIQTNQALFDMIGRTITAGVRFRY